MTEDPVHPTLVQHTMRYWLLHPDVRLQERVRCYFVVDAGHRPYPKTELLLPDGYAEIIFAMEAGFERWGVGEAGKRTVMRHSYLIGGRSHSVLTGGSTRLRLVGVKLDPCLLRDIIATPLNEFRDATLELSDLHHQPLLSLENAIADASSVSEIKARLDGFFLRQLDAASPCDPLIAYFLRRIHAQRGAGSITEWTRDLGVDTRTLERRFSASVGMTPKKYARIIRFKHSYHRLCSAGRTRRAAGDDHLNGYYDQSHFNKEFRYFTGMAPSALIGAQAASSTAVTDHLLRGELSPASLSISGCTGVDLASRTADIRSNCPDRSAPPTASITG